MPRSRMIHQEFFTSPSLGKVPPNARLLFIAMWIHSDDEGHCLADPAYWRGIAFPYDRRIGVADVQQYVVKLQEAGAVDFYEHEGVTYLRIPSWKRWQKIDRPSQWRVDRPRLSESSTSTRDPLDEHSTSTRRALASQAQAQPEAQAQENLTRTREKSKRDSRVKQLVDSIFESLQAKLGVKPVMPFGQMGKDLARLLVDRQPEDILGVWSHWLDSPDAFAKEHAWSWPMFIRNFSAVDVALKEGRPYGQGHRGRAQANTLPAPAAEFRGGDFFAEPGVDS